MSHPHGQDHATAAAEKLEHFFKTLNPQEQEVVSEMVRSALLHAATEHDPGAAQVPAFVQGLTGKTAPLLVKALRLPGSLAAHSIPGCNASILAGLKTTLEHG